MTGFVFIRNLKYFKMMSIIQKTCISVLSSKPIRAKASLEMSSNNITMRSNP